MFLSACYSNLWWISMKRLGVFLLRLDGMLVHRRVTPSSKFAGIAIYTKVEKVSCACPEMQNTTQRLTI